MRVSASFTTIGLVVLSHLASAAVIPRDVAEVASADIPEVPSSDVPEVPSSKEEFDHAVKARIMKITGGLDAAVNKILDDIKLKGIEIIKKVETDVHEDSAQKDVEHGEAAIVPRDHVPGHVSEEPSTTTTEEGANQGAKKNIAKLTDSLEAAVNKIVADIKLKGVEVLKKVEEEAHESADQKDVASEQEDVKDVEDAEDAEEAEQLDKRGVNRSGNKIIRRRVGNKIIRVRQTDADDETDAADEADADDEADTDDVEEEDH